MMIQQVVPTETSSASTSDWIGQVKDCVIYAYDLSTLVSAGAGIIEFTKGDFELALKKASRKRNMPIGQHIQEAIRTLGGKND